MKQGTLLLSLLKKTRFISCGHVGYKGRLWREHDQGLVTLSLSVIQNNYDSEMMVLLYITSCTEKIFFESAVVAKRFRLIRVIYFLTTASEKEVSPSQSPN